MSRLEWILGGILAILLVAIVGVLTIFFFRSANPDDQETRPIDQYTAQSAYQIALPIAQQWQADAQLLSANVSWPRGPQFAVGDGHWGFTFYSPSQQAIVIISTIGTQGQLVRTQTINRQLNLASVADWPLDSNSALAKFFEFGGQDFLDDQGEAALLLTLNTNPTLTWTGQLMDREALRSFQLKFDARTGDIISVQQAPASQPQPVTTP
ncbi:MAG TPA: hypothetical protein VLL52_10085 [Anaerolineae bacterium]|nr:hypothetical protein [Anaerolineae bacterium]